MTRFLKSPVGLSSIGPFLLEVEIVDVQNHQKIMLYILLEVTFFRKSWIHPFDPLQVRLWYLGSIANKKKIPKRRTFNQIMLEF